MCVCVNDVICAMWVKTKQICKNSVCERVCVNDAICAIRVKTKKVCRNSAVTVAGIDSFIRME